MFVWVDTWTLTISTCTINSVCILIGIGAKSGVCMYIYEVYIYFTFTGDEREPTPPKKNMTFRRAEPVTILAGFSRELLR